jgi:transglutaminase-like putative cysteine protease
MTKAESRIFNILCYAWMAVLILGININNHLTTPGILLFAVVFFCLLDLVLERPWPAAIIKVLISLLLIHRTFYVGSIISPRWLEWLVKDLQADWAFMTSQGYLRPGTVTGMIVALATVGMIQSLYYALISRRKGVIWLLFAGSFVLVAVSLYSGANTSLLVYLYVVMGLIILATVKLQQINFKFSFSRWLSVLMVWSLCLTSIAWVMPDGKANFNEMYEQAKELWEEFRERGKVPSPAHPSVGYGVYDDNLGQTLVPSFELIFLVTSPVAVYLRGESRDYYTGTGWQDNLRASPIPYISPRTFHPSGIPGREVEVKIQVVQRQAHVLFAPRFPMEFSFESGSSFLALGQDNDYGDFEFRLTQLLREGEVYTVFTFIPDDDSGLLRTLGHGGADPRYLQLPRGLPGRVRALAEQLTRDYDNGYDKVRALIRYLASNYPYTLESQRPLSGHDFVDHFLFEQRAGYCVHFATAVVVMARSQGIPARWVKGFAPGIRVGSTYYVTSNHAHAWVEIWFEDYGWVPFEATPGFGRPDQPGGPADPGDGGTGPGGGNNATGPEIPGEPEPGQPGENPGVTPGAAQNWSLLLIVAGILLLAAAAVLFLVGGGGPPVKGIARTYAWLQNNLSWFGWQRAVWETPREHWKRVNSLVPEAGVMEGFVSEFEHSLYGGGNESPQTRKNLKKTFNLFKLLRHRFKKS